MYVKSKWVVPADFAHLGGLNIMGPTGLVLSGIPMQGYLAEQAPTGPLARATWQNKLPQDPLPESYLAEQAPTGPLAKGYLAEQALHRTPCQGYLAEQET